MRNERLLVVGRKKDVEGFLLRKIRRKYLKFMFNITNLLTIIAIKIYCTQNNLFSFSFCLVLTPPLAHKKQNATKLSLSTHLLKCGCEKGACRLFNVSNLGLYSALWGRTPAPHTAPQIGGGAAAAGPSP